MWDVDEHDTPRQLTLLPDPVLAPSDAPLQFRLDADTRQRGLRHVAEIRRQLDERRAGRLSSAA
jgi:hypothetical protein